MTSLLTNIPLFVKSIGGTDFSAGLATSMFTIFSVAIRPYLGNYMDKNGRVKVLTLGILTYSLSVIMLMFTENLYLLYLIRIVQGLGWGAFYIASYTIAADIAPKNKRFEYLGIFSAVPQLGMSIGPLLAALIVSSFNFYISFLLTSVVAVLSLLISIFVKEAYDKEDNNKDISQDSKIIIISKTAIYPSVVMMMITFCLGAVVTFVPLLGSARNIDNTTIFFTVFGGIVIVIRPLGGKITKLIGKKFVLTACLISIILSMLMIAYSYDIQSLTMAAVLFGLGFSLPVPVLLTMCVESADSGGTGTNMSTFTSAIDIGVGLGAVSLGTFLVYFDYTIIFLLCSIITLGNLMLYFKYSKTHLS